MHTTSAYSARRRGAQIVEWGTSGRERRVAGGAVTAMIGEHGCATHSVADSLYQKINREKEHKRMRKWSNVNRSLTVKFYQSVA